VDDLIEALTILRKYGNPSSPTHCEHDELTVCIDPALVSTKDKARLVDLGLFVDEDYECFKSYRFGNA